MSTSTELTLVEVAKLENLEIVIAANKDAAFLMADALRVIKEEKLYRGVYLTFDEYVGTRWGFSRQRAYQLIKAAEVSTAVDDDIPERHAREIAKADKEQWPEIVEEVQAKAESEERRPTADDYKQAVKERSGEIVTKPKVSAHAADEFDAAIETAKDLINEESRIGLLATWANKIEALLTICRFRQKSFDKH